MSGWEKAGDGCTCSVNPNPFTHYGATEPGDALEPDPECPKHFPTRTIEQEAQAEAERRIDENAWLFRRDTEAGWFLNGFIKGAEWGASRPVTDERRRSCQQPPGQPAMGHGLIQCDRPCSAGHAQHESKDTLLPGT